MADTIDARLAIQPHDTFSEKLSREAQLLWIGLKAVPEAGKREIEEHPWQAAGKVALSAIISIALAYATRGRGQAVLGSARLALGLKAASTGLGVAGVLDAAHCLKPTFAAMNDAAHANYHWQQDVEVMQQSFAPFVFDMALGTAGSLGVGILGKRMLSYSSYEPQLPPLRPDGTLPEGIHASTWREFADRYGYNATRKRQLSGIQTLMQEIRKNKAGDSVFVGGSFVTGKKLPGDFDLTWRVSGKELSHLGESAPLLTDRALQRATLGGELIPTYPNSPNDGTIGFLQLSKANKKVGLVHLNVDSLPSPTLLHLQDAALRAAGTLRSTLRMSGR